MKRTLIGIGFLIFFSCWISQNTTTHAAALSENNLRHSLHLSQDYVLQNLAIRKMFEGEESIIVAQYCQKGGSSAFEKQSISITLQQKKVSFQTVVLLSPVGGNSCSDFFRIASTRDLDIPNEKQMLSLIAISPLHTQTFSVKFSPPQNTGDVQIRAEITKQKEKISVEITPFGYKEKIQDISLLLLPAYERQAEKRISKAFLGFRNSIARGSISTKNLSGQYCLMITAYDSKGNILGREEKIILL
jgi:hypothetical protein